LTSSPCYASTLTYTATLNGASENPPTGSPATGFVVYTLTGDMLTVDLSFTGLTALASAAHIHCCAAVGVNAPVVVPFALFPNTLSGTYTNIFDLSTFAFSGGGSEAALLAAFNNGTAYTNIHNANFPGGEIRGQITPVKSRTTHANLSRLALLGTGALVVLSVIRKKMRV
jgi:hypothetical protein